MSTLYESSMFPSKSPDYAVTICHSLRPGWPFGFSVFVQGYRLRLEPPQEPVAMPRTARPATKSAPRLKKSSAWRAFRSRM